MLNMNTNVQVLPSASHDHNTMLGAGATIPVSTSESVSAETNFNTVSIGQLSTDNNVSVQNNREFISHDQLSTRKKQSLNSSNAGYFQQGENVSQAICELLSPCETKTISELAEMIKLTGLYGQFSDKEFESLIISRRPLELLFMANASIYKSL